MRRSLIAFLVAGAACAEPRATVPPPTFAQFPAPAVHQGQGAPIRWDSFESATRFRTVLEAGRVAGPNFAGHLRIVTWGCGTQCQEFLLLDMRDGRVVADTVLDFSCHRPEFALGSTLVIQHSLAGTDGPCAVDRSRYFRWNGETFVEIAPGTT